MDIWLALLIDAQSGKRGNWRKKIWETAQKSKAKMVLYICTRKTATNQMELNVTLSENEK